MQELVLNYHVTEKCNYSCQYCFAKYELEERFKDELHWDLAAVETLLRETYNHFRTTYEVSRIRLNLAGGEPLLLSSIGKIIDVAKDIGYELSLITNSSPLTSRFIKDNAAKLSLVGISIDSFSYETNIRVGRSTSSGKVNSSAEIQQKIQLLRDLNSSVSIKINTVVSGYNCNEDMGCEINKLAPDKWKIFKELRNDGHSIDDRMFDDFVKRNTVNISCPVFVENNDEMTNSYLMIDPLGRFYQNSNANDNYIYSEAILQVGIERALSQIVFDRNKFENRYVSMQEKHNKVLHSDGNSAALLCRR